MLQASFFLLTSSNLVGCATNVKCKECFSFWTNSSDKHEKEKIYWRKAIFKCKIESSRIESETTYQPLFYQIHLCCFFCIIFIQICCIHDLKPKSMQKIKYFVARVFSALPNEILWIVRIRAVLWMPEETRSLKHSFVYFIFLSLTYQSVFTMLESDDTVCMRLTTLFALFNQTHKWV